MDHLNVPSREFEQDEPISEVDEVVKLIRENKQLKRELYKCNEKINSLCEEFPDYVTSEEEVMASLERIRKIVEL